MTSRRHGLVVQHWQCFGCIPWLQNLKNDAEIFVLSQILLEMSLTSSMTSQHDVKTSLGNHTALALLSLDSQIQKTVQTTPRSLFQHKYFPRCNWRQAWYIFWNSHRFRYIHVGFIKSNREGKNRQGVMGWSYRIGNALVAFLDLKTLKTTPRSLFYHKYFQRCHWRPTWRHNMTSKRHGLVVWAATIRFHIAHIFMNILIYYTTLHHKNSPRKIIFQHIRANAVWLPSDVLTSCCDVMLDFDAISRSICDKTMISTSLLVFFLNMEFQLQHSQCCRINSWRLDVTLTLRLTLSMTSQRDAIASWGNPRAFRLLSL